VRDHFRAASQRSMRATSLSFFAVTMSARAAVTSARPRRDFQIYKPGFTWFH
jgi:hypothetical protein